MSDTTGRLLTLLSLLQSPRDWPGSELAQRLRVTERTVRNDVARLRRLGYPVRASRGAVGGYRLVAGTALPPLLLDDEEAVAVVVGLRSAGGGAITGLEESSSRALAKLQEVLPARLAAHVDALSSAMLRVGPMDVARAGPGRAGSPVRQVDGGVLTLLAAAARDREIVRFGYVDRGATSSQRRAEPHRLVSMGRRWYLLAFDLDREDWRTFRVDRMDDVRSVGHRFAEREPPTDDVAAYVAARNRRIQLKVRGTVIVHAPAEVVRERIGWWGESAIEPLSGSICRLDVGGRSMDLLAHWLGSLEADFDIVGPPELGDAVARVARRYARSARAHHWTRHGPPYEGVRTSG